MSVGYYHSLLADEARIRAFQVALTERVHPGDRVLEIGTGLGTFALFAVRAGASRVWAVDTEAIVHVAEAVAAHNGLAGSIQWLRGRVPDVTLPEPVDLLVFEDFSTRLLDCDTWRMLARAQARYLAPEGQMVPDRAELFLAPVSSARLWESLLPLRRDRFEAYGIDWAPTLSYAENTPHAVSLTPEELAAPPVRIASPSLLPVPSAAALGGTATWAFEAPCSVHGLALWFELEVAAGHRVSNRPGPACGPWGQVFLPFAEPLAVAAGSPCIASVAPQPLRDGAPGWLHWEARSGAVCRSGHEFASEPAALDDIFPEEETP
ncbi:MAG: class I SAM-dependent methyltransferase [Gemmatimonadota bacterium]